MEKNSREPNLLEALIPLIILIALLSFNVVIYNDTATSGPNQIALIIGAVVAALIGGLYSITELRKIGAEETVYSKHRELKQASKQASVTNQDTSR